MSMVFIILLATHLLSEENMSLERHERAGYKFGLGLENMVKNQRV